MPNQQPLEGPCITNLTRQKMAIHRYGERAMGHVATVVEARNNPRTTKAS
jgi:hypothetical protein